MRRGEACDAQQATPRESLRSYFGSAEALRTRFLLNVFRLDDRLATVPEVEARLEHELDLVREMGFAGYFLIVWDLCRHAQDNNLKLQFARSRLTRTARYSDRLDTPEGPGCCRRRRHSRGKLECGEHRRW